MNTAFVERLIGSALRRNDVAVALVVAVTTAMIVLPLPTWLVDTLIACNIASAVTLIMVVMYVPTPLSFSSFPSLLLLTTLFRLALSISTTRLILLQADAGRIVESFGKFVVGGNIVVGLVVFLIITVVQFIVITKGAERVAEVSARFSLDAMPGKQMSIDGDMRAGLIDLEQARQRRRVVEKESQLYGSLDGAMKFVKGDAIAGLFIALINIVGGIAVGTLQHDMSLGQASDVYTVLTVGDGLVAQIPALLIGVASGIIVTRVTNSERSNLGQDIGRQIVAQPQALIVTSALLFGLAFVPGFPSPVFLVLSVVVGIVGFTLQRVSGRRAGTEAASLKAMRDQQDSQTGATSSASDALPRSAALLVSFHGGIRPALDQMALDGEFERVSRGVFAELGLPPPEVGIRFGDALDEGHYLVSVHDVPVGGGRLCPDRLAAGADAATLRRLGIDQDAIISGSGVSEGFCWVSERWRNTLLQGGVSFLTAPQFVAHHLGRVLRRHAGDLMGVQQARRLLDAEMPHAPELVREASGSIPLPLLAETLRRLVSEGVPVRNLAIILETVLHWIEDGRDAAMLAERCRAALRRQISHRFADEGVLEVLMLATEAEDAARHLTSGEVGVEVRQRLLRGVSDAVDERAGRNIQPPLLVEPALRTALREHLRHSLPHAPVLSFEEVSDEVRVHVLARIPLADTQLNSTDAAPSLTA